MSPVTVSRAPVILPTYQPQPPDLNPMFLERRVYQGSSGKIYPLPFTDRIAEQPGPRGWDAIYLENQFLAVMLLPEIGGRIHAARDKTNGYDFIYRQDVIKPALVGLAGPWVSGGIEFNWPQHHRPSTFMPVEVDIEHHDDGAVTVWMGDHDPITRLKGMHGVCLRPGRAVLELRVRVYNRTPLVQTFLWWANLAARVHEGYQSFFPPDVTSIADHAKRAMSEYPLCQGRYYGVDYAARARLGTPPAEVPRHYVPPHCLKGSEGAAASSLAAEPSHYLANDLSWYANIPVPTSYMAVGSAEDFFGGYDHHARAGLVHVADHRIAPGKKQWTWGNQEFGYAWDRNLTDADASGEFPPYIELMAGVFTDNQPDFSFLQPGETKTWTQSWYPIREIGPAQQANLDAAVSLVVAHGWARVGIAVTAVRPRCTIRVKCRGKTLADPIVDLAPDRPYVAELKLPRGARVTDLRLVVQTPDRRELIAYAPRVQPKRVLPAAATEPPLPSQVATNEELFLIGLHLEQYRHATRRPIDYWREALRRDPGDARCNNAVGLWHLRRGEARDAEAYFRGAIARLTARNPNPLDGEPYYNLGLCLRARADSDATTATQLLAEAYEAFFKSTWNQAWQPAGFHALAELDCLRSDWLTALAHLEAALRVNLDNLRARNLKVVVLRRLRRTVEADALLNSTLALDPLDHWAKHLRDAASCTAVRGDPIVSGDTQARLDLAHDYARAGLFSEALLLLADARPEPGSGTAPMLHYTAAWFCEKIGEPGTARRHRVAAAKASPDYCFPARLEEIYVLEAALVANPRDGRAAYFLGNLFYDRLRHAEAMVLWEKAARFNPRFSVVWRNLGIGYFNVAKNPAKARAAYDHAIRANPDDARLRYERDQLWKRLGVTPAKRLRALEPCRALVDQRDDLSIELCALWNQTGRPAAARDLISIRKFQPWEGGEGLVLGQHARAHLALGRQALAAGDATAARNSFEVALTAPVNLGEARHLLANSSDVHFWLGCALEALGERSAAGQHWEVAADFKGDFQEMRVRAFSELTYFSARAAQKLGRSGAARRLLRDLQAFARRLAQTPVGIDYFATSLPTMLLFEDDVPRRQKITALFLEAQARAGLGETSAARRLIARVLRLEPSHGAAADLRAELSVAT